MFLRDSSLNEIRTGLPELGSELGPGEAEIFYNLFLQDLGRLGWAPGRMKFLQDIFYEIWTGLPGLDSWLSSREAEIFFTRICFARSGLGCLAWAPGRLNLFTRNVFMGSGLGCLG